MKLFWRLSVFVFCLLFLSSCDFSKHPISNYTKIKNRSLKSHEKEVVLNFDIDTTNLMLVKASHRNFYIPKRKDQITRYKCSKCHTESIQKLQTASATYDKRTHQEIKLQHSNTLIMECTTCHTDHNMDVLHNMNQTSIDFNESYRLCGQCHPHQFEDWKGGAHGKRISFWAEPRISKTCVQCHNPHNPAFKQKYPARHFIGNEE